MTSKISAARAHLHGELAAALAPMPWRAHLYPPANIGGPMVYIGTYAADAAEPRMVVNFPVIVVTDGADRRQVEQLDDIGAAVSDAILRAGGIPRRTAAYFGAEIPASLRASETTAEFTLSALTLCLPILEEVAS